MWSIGLPVLWLSVDEVISEKKVDGVSHGAFFIGMSTKAKPTAPDRSEYMAAYYRKRREDLRKIKHERYLENREEHIATMQATKGRGKNAAVEAGGAPPVRRRWLVIGDRVYFNSRLGVSKSEMSTVVSDLQKSIARQSDDPEEFTRNSIRQRKHMDYLKNRKGEITRMRSYREKVFGSTPRKEEPVGSRITVSKRRWIVVGNRLYFNPKVELTLQDVRKAVSDLQKSVMRLSGS